MTITEIDKSIWKFAIICAVLVIVPGLVLAGTVGWAVAQYPIVGAISWLFGGFMTWGWGKYKLIKRRQQRLNMVR